MNIDIKYGKLSIALEDLDIDILLVKLTCLLASSPRITTRLLRVLDLISSVVS